MKLYSPQVSRITLTQNNLRHLRIAKLLSHLSEQVDQIVRMLFFDGQDVFH